jgi:hypothetical protein
MTATNWGRKRPTTIRPSLVGDASQMRERFCEAWPNDSDLVPIMRRSLALVCLFAACLVIAVPGCGRRMVKVKGKFVKNGAVQTFPADQYVTLQFVPADVDDGRRAFSATIDHANGTYEVEVLSGQYRISFFAQPLAKPDPKTNAPAGPPLVKRPSGPAADQTVYNFTSSTTQDITVP